MAIKKKFVDKYANYEEREGTIHKMTDDSDKANQSRAEETDIKNIIKKYGILPIEMLNQAKENLYLDNRGESLSINERLKQKEQMDNYFESLPAKVRKNFNDSKEEFYQSVMNDDLERLLSNNIYNEQQVFEKQTEIIKKQQEKQAQLDRISQLEQQLETMKGQIQNEQLNIKEN